MKFHILIDNRPSTPAVQQQYPDSGLVSEHGLSILFSQEGRHYLTDTGASGKFIGNMEKMHSHLPQEISLAEDIDAVFISHGHNDHTGGLRKFFETNAHAPAWLHESIRGSLYFSCRQHHRDTAAVPAKVFRNISMEKALYREHGDRLRSISGITEITPSITLVPVGGTPGKDAEGHLLPRYPLPRGNDFLYKDDFPDDFEHELAVLVHDGAHYAVLSPCSHNGILNILSRCRECIAAREGIPQDEAAGKLKGFIGGLHYVDYLGNSKSYTHADPESEQIRSTARLVLEGYPSLQVWSGHCTCDAAADLLQEEMGGRYGTFCTGMTIEL